MQKSTKNMSKKTARTIKKAIKKANSGSSLFPDKTTVGIMLFSMSLDMFFIYSVTDSVFTQLPILSIVSALIIAFNIDSLPVIIASRLEKKYKTKLDKMLIFLGISLFIFFITCIFALRLATMETTYNDSGADMEISTTITLNNTDINDSLTENSVTSDVSTYEPTAAELTMTILLAMTPLATSILVFAVATHRSLKFKIMHSADAAIRDLQNHKTQLNAHLLKLKEKSNTDSIAKDNKLFTNLLYQFEKEAQGLRIIARTELAKKVGTEDATSVLLESPKLSKLSAKHKI